MPSRAYRLKTEEEAAAGIRRIAAGRAERALERLRGADERELAAAVHGARKDMKKLRGLLRLVRDELGKKTFETEDRRYRDAGRALSGNRDAEVKLATLLALRRRFDDLPTDATERWAGRLETERDQLAVVAVGASEGKIGEAVEAIEAGRDAIGGWPLETDSWELVGPGLSTGLPPGAHGNGPSTRRPVDRERPRVAQTRQGSLVPAADHPRGLAGAARRDGRPRPTI